MGQLVQDGHGAPLDAGLDGSGAEDVVVAVGDAAGVLHRPGIELGHEDLVVLGEGVGRCEQLLVVGEASFGQVQDLLGVHVLDHALAAVDPQGHGAPVAGHVLVCGADVGACHNGRDVGAHRLGGGEGEGTGLSRAVGRPCPGRLGGGGVGQHRPARRGGDGEGEGGFEIGLLEDSEDPSGVGHLELAVEVGLAVGRIGEAVQALSGVHVGAVGVDDQLVVRGQVHQRDP